MQERVRADVQLALEEDIGSGDLTAALVPPDSHAQAGVVVREWAILCGQPWFDECFRQCGDGIVVDWHVTEGDEVDADTQVCTITGPAAPILTAERTALNFLQTLSATATSAHRYRAAASSHGTRILDTRKTLPGLRYAQKYAVRTGGAENHRRGLHDAILIKENHIIACGGVAAAVQRARDLAPDVLVEVEVESLVEMKEALDAGAPRVLLDNFTPEELKRAAGVRDSDYPAAELEASGGITLETLATIAATGVDFISVGGLTKDIRATDFSLRFALL